MLIDKWEVSRNRIGVIPSAVVTVIISNMGSVRVMNNDSHFEAEMASSGTKLVVVDFTASWWVLSLIVPIWG